MGTVGLTLVFTVLVLAAIATQISVPWVALEPGSANPAEDRVQVTGAQTFTPDGDILFLTVRVNQLSLLELLTKSRDTAIDLVGPPLILYRDAASKAMRAVRCGTFACDIAPGFHELQLRIDWCTSNVVPFDAADGMELIDVRLDAEGIGARRGEHRRRLGQREGLPFDEDVDGARQAASRHFRNQFIGDHGEVVDGALLVSGGDAPELLEPGEEVLHAVALAVGLAVEVALPRLVLAGGNDGADASGAQAPPSGGAAVALVTCGPTRAQARSAAPAGMADGTAIHQRLQCNPYRRSHQEENPDYSTGSR